LKLCDSVGVILSFDYPTLTCATVGILLSWVLETRTLHSGILQLVYYTVVFCSS